MHFSRIALIGALVFPARAHAQPPFPLDTLRVEVGARTSALLPVATRSVQVMDRVFIESTPAQTVAELLHWAVGVDVQARSPAQADVAIRGGSFEEVLVLVDGVRMSDAQTGHFDLDVAVPLQDVERIEVLRGPASAQYGSDAVGGVIHIVTRRRGAPIEARVEGGSHETAAAWLSGGLGNGTRALRWGLEHARSDGSRDGTDYRVTQARVAADARLGSGTLRGDVAFAARDFGAADFYAPFGSYEETRTLTLSTAWSGTAAGIVLEPRIHARRHGDDFILIRTDPEVYRNRHTTWQVGADVAGRATVSDAVTLVVGAEAVRDAIDSNALGDRSESRAALFGEVEWGRSGAALLHAGLRTDWHEEYGSFVAPSLAAAVWPVQTVRVRASAGRSFRGPGWTERFYEDPANIGTADLDPERAWTMELGVDVVPTSIVRIDVAAFLRHADALVDWAKQSGASDTDPWRTMNIEDATFRGIEAALEVHALGARWSAGFTTLSLEADEESGYISKYALRPLTETLFAGTQLRVRSLTFGAQARHARRRGEDAYALVDARVGYAIGAAHLYLDATNLLDEDYLDVSVQPGPGRALRVGLAWSAAR